MTKRVKRKPEKYYSMQRSEITKQLQKLVDPKENKSRKSLTNFKRFKIYETNKWSLHLDVYVSLCIINGFRFWITKGPNVDNELSKPCYLKIKDGKANVYSDYKIPVKIQNKILSTYKLTKSFANSSRAKIV